MSGSKLGIKIAVIEQGMKDKLQKAIRNNNGLYEAIFSGHNIKSHRTDSIWYSLEETPPLYSNLITISKDWKPDAIFRAIDLNYEEGKWDKWSLKDSFGVLDLSRHGFTRLFDAQWMYLEAANFIQIEGGQKLRYEILNREDALPAWRSAWDSDERLGEEIFDTKLLADQRVHFVAGYKEEQIVSGCFLNKTDDVLGVSNFFSPGEGIGYWSDMISFICGSIECLDIVGYERNDLVEKLQSLGFESIGNLTVWLKKRNA
jgi:hypothetical protein